MMNKAGSSRKNQDRELYADQEEAEDIDL